MWQTISTEYHDECAGFKFFVYSLFDLNINTGWTLNITGYLHDIDVGIHNLCGNITVFGRGIKDNWQISNNNEKEKYWWPARTKYIKYSCVKSMHCLNRWNALIAVRRLLLERKTAYNQYNMARELSGEMIKDTYIELILASLYTYIDNWRRLLHTVWVWVAKKVQNWNSVNKVLK